MKIFCLSFQRTGTTSVGEFFRKEGYKVASYGISDINKWDYYYYNKDYNSIFTSDGFKENEVFEDSPWWFSNFYKIIHTQFPNSKFILFERDPNKWFNSMMSHSYNRTIGLTEIHCYLYSRLDEIKFNTPKYNGLPLNENHREHYISIYNKRNNEIKDYFSNNNSFITLTLENPNKWDILSDFFNIKRNHNVDVWVNRSN